MPDSTNPFFAEVAKGIEDACFRAGYALVRCNSDRSPEKEFAQARLLREKRVDGVLLFSIGEASGDTITWLQVHSLPVLLLERRSSQAAVDCVVSDNAAGVRAAIDHLARLGHRRVACLIGNLDAAHYADRLTAYEEAVRDFGLIEEASFVRSELTSYADGLSATVDLLQLSGPPTALFCATDTLAIGALRGTATAGKRIPGDISIVGYGDIELAAFVQPPLTSVVQEKETVGAKAVRLLLRRVGQQQEGRSWRASVQVVPTRLVVRESTGPAPTE